MDSIVVTFFLAVILIGSVFLFSYSLAQLRNERHVPTAYWLSSTAGTVGAYTLLRNGSESFDMPIWVGVAVLMAIGIIWASFLILSYMAIGMWWLFKFDEEMPPTIHLPASAIVGTVFFIGTWEGCRFFLSIWGGI